MGHPRRGEASGGEAQHTGYLPVSAADGLGEEDPAAADAVGGVRRTGAHGHASACRLQRKHIQEILQPLMAAEKHGKHQNRRSGAFFCALSGAEQNNSEQIGTIQNKLEQVGTGCSKTDTRNGSMS